MTPIVAVTTAPLPFVSLDEAKAHLRVISADEDALITTYVAAACAHIDGPAAWLGRSIGEQTIEARFDGFPSCPLWLPAPQVLTIESVKYIDRDGVEQTLAEADYRLIGLGTDKASIEPAYGQDWPSTREDVEAVRIAYTGGYETVPAPLKAAVLLMVGDLYANRETVVTGTVAGDIPMSMTVRNLLAAYRVY